MQTLSVLTVEDGVILVASPAGERFRLPLDAALRARIASPSASSSEKRLSPREIQAHVRAGLTAQQVAALTGVPVAFIERFVGPVLAERAYIVETALAVRLPPETEGARSRTFGAVMGERLDALAAKDVRWTSSKEPSGWVLAVGFVADEVQHSARWRFDAKHMHLDADNVEASTLSQQGVPAALTPRLRAIEPTAPVTIVPPPVPSAPPAAVEAPPAPRPAQLHGTRVAPLPRTEPDRSRFDSAVFRFAADELAPPAEQTPTAPARTSSPTDRPTTDHLTQLQRRRGERQPPPAGGPDTVPLPVATSTEVLDPGDVFAPRPPERAAPTEHREPAPRRETASVHRLPVRSASPVVEERQPEPMRRRRDRARRAPGPSTPIEPQPVDADEPVDTPGPSVRPRRGRTSMPSWDEIVFGRDEP